MIDLTCIGNEGLIVQWEDVVSMVGYNILHYLRAKTNDPALMKHDPAKIAVSYVDRDEHDICEWIKTSYGVEVQPSDYQNSLSALQPNLLYVYKKFDTAYRNGQKNLTIHSNFESEHIREFITKTFPIPVNYTHGDILPVLKMNCTFMTSNVPNLLKISEMNLPFEVVMVDDYMYMRHYIHGSFPKKLREMNKHVRMTSIITAGLIK